MSLKEFKCTACGHQFEEVLWINDPNPEKCPKCQGALKQLLGTFRIAGVRSKSARADQEKAEGGIPGAEMPLGGAGPEGAMGEGMGDEYGGDLGDDADFGDEDAGGADLGDEAGQGPDAGFGEDMPQGEPPDEED